jgi:N-acyl-D-aspartate/D-glutamate deacylase
VGYIETIVAGQTVMDDGRFTGATPGRLIRGGAESHAGSEITPSASPR